METARAGEGGASDEIFCFASCAASAMLELEEETFFFFLFFLAFDLLLLLLGSNLSLPELFLADVPSARPIPRTRPRLAMPKRTGSPFVSLL